MKHRSYHSKWIRVFYAGLQLVLEILVFPFNLLIRILDFAEEIAK